MLAVKLHRTRTCGSSIAATNAGKSGRAPYPTWNG